MLLKYQSYSKKRIYVEHYHQSAKVIGDITKITDKGNSRLDGFKTSIAWILSIITIAIEVILKEYIDNNVLQKEFDAILIYFEKILKIY